MAKVEKGQFVALGLDEFKHELPQIARILMIEEDVMNRVVGRNIQWYMESMDSQVSGADCNSAQKLYSSRECNII